MSTHRTTQLCPQLTTVVRRLEASGSLDSGAVHARAEGLGATLMGQRVVDRQQNGCSPIRCCGLVVNGQDRVPQIMKVLVSYGAHAQAVIPQLEALADDYADGEPDFPRRLSKDKEAAVRKAIEQIKASQERPKLISIGGPRVG